MGLCFSDKERSGDVHLLPAVEQARGLHLDADVRHPGLQHQERERAVHPLRQLRAERLAVRPRGDGPQAGGPAHCQDKEGRGGREPARLSGEQRSVLRQIFSWRVVCCKYFHPQMVNTPIKEVRAAGTRPTSAWTRAWSPTRPRATTQRTHT